LSNGLKIVVQLTLKHCKKIWVNLPELSSSVIRPCSDVSSYAVHLLPFYCHAIMSVCQQAEIGPRETRYSSSCNYTQN